MLCVDNIFVDVMVEMENNKFWEDNATQPGANYTAHDDFFKNLAKEILVLDQDPNYNAKLQARTPGGCGMNTTRAANFYLTNLENRQY